MPTTHGNDPTGLTGGSMNYLTALREPVTIVASY